MMKRLIQSLAFVLIIYQAAFCQDPARFQDEINKIQADAGAYAGMSDLVLFTGSSSIRLWTGLAADFPGIALVNTGFGGSHMSDLLFYADVLILQYKPVKIIIYEGDNDIESGKETTEILADATRLVKLIRLTLPEAPVYFISAKPSLARWHLKEKYIKYNRQLSDFATATPLVHFIDVWSIMLDDSGNPQPGIFLEDGLHLNLKGYDIWKEVVGRKAGIGGEETGR